MEILFLGAAESVTGSMHLVETKHGSILLDCGLFQGRRQEAFERNRNLAPEATRADAVVLSHAHIDHSGALPMLTKHGFQGRIYATPATRDLCAIMLADAAMIQEQDARHIQRQIERHGSQMQPVEPLYNKEDVVRTLGRMIAVPYHAKQTILPGVDLTFLDAGHVLGSAVTALDITEGKTKKRLVFTGDLGRLRTPILRDPEIVPHADFLITESTYGSRLHEPIEAMGSKLEAILDRTFRRGGKVLIPSFALERAQEVLYALQHLKTLGKMPPMHVYVDSPLATRVSDVFRLHPDCYDEEARARLLRQPSPFDFQGLTYIGDADESKALTADTKPAIIIAASGMCEAGRILFHLKAAVEDSKNTIVIVGFQAQHTLGRRIVERRPRVRIFGVERDLAAEVVVLNGFSAHADQNGLLGYATQTASQGSLSGIALVHGEPDSQAILRDLLMAKVHVPIHVPHRNERITVQ